MESRAKLLGHPIHPVLIVFPLGLLASAVIFDLITLLTGEPRWTEISLYMIGAGVTGGLLAAIFGLTDYLAIPRGTRAKRIGAIHGIGNVIVLLLFTASWLLRLIDPSYPGKAALILGFAGILLALGTGWLGGELVFRLGVGIDEGSNVNAPNSLKSEPPHEAGEGLRTT